MEPAPFPRLLMDIFHIPFALFAARKPFQKVLGAVGGILRVQQRQGIDIFAHTLPRQTQQPFHIWAEIICLVGFCIQHQENVVHVLGQLLEQLVPAQNLVILAAQLDVTPARNQQNDQHGNRQNNAGYNLHRAQPKLIHTGIDDIYGDNARHDPVLDTGALVDQIVSCAAHRHLTVSAGTFCKVAGKLLHLRLGKVGIIAQYRNKVIDGFLALCNIFNHDLPIRVDDIAAGSTAESRFVHSFHHVGIVAADGDGIVGKAAVDALGFGADKHQHRFLPRQNRVHHNVVLVGKLLVEVALQTKIACFTAGCHVVAVVRKKVESGKAKLLLRRLQIRLRSGIIGVAVQKAVPQMQIGDVFVGDHAQHTVGFMQNFIQMRGAFFVDGFGYKRKVLHAKADKKRDRQQNSGSGQPFARKTALCFQFSLIIFHSVLPPPNVI